MTFSNTLESINEAIQTLSTSGNVKEEERQELLEASQKLQQAAESPLDGVLSIVLGIHRQAAIRTAIEMGLFGILIGVKEDGMEAKELAAKTGADSLLIIRIMRFLTALGYAKEIGQSKYTPTPKTGSLVDGSPLVDVVTHISIHSQVLVKLPEYLRETGYQHPNDAYDSPFQYALNTKLGYFDWIKQDEKQQAAFSRMMQLTRLERGKSWFDFYPVEENFQQADKDTPLLVDVGGGLGFDVAEFHIRFPNLQGQLILQDLPAAIDNVKDLSSDIKVMKYDFFTPQPIKGARAYYLRQILHDWPDKQSRQILEIIRDAMSPESVLLVNENDLPAENATLYSANIDLSMMALFSSMERTQAQWVELVESAGFDVVNVWKADVLVASGANLIEAVCRKSK